MATKAPAQTLPTSESQEYQPAEVSLVKTPYKILLQWKAPARPYKKRNREYFTTIGAIVFLLAVILLFLKEWLLIGAIIAFAFLAYVLASVPPETISYKITTRGIEVADKQYSWERLGRFWFTKKWGSKVLHIDHWGLPTQLLLVYTTKVNKQELRKHLDKFLYYQKPDKTPIDKAAEWLQKKVPLESEPAKPSASSRKK